MTHSIYKGAYKKIKHAIICNTIQHGKHTASTNYSTNYSTHYGLWCLKNSRLLISMLDMKGKEYSLYCTCIVHDKKRLSFQTVFFITQTLQSFETMFLHDVEKRVKSPISLGKPWPND